jgi:sugar lactone lactonase YvrE
VTVARRRILLTLAWAAVLVVALGGRNASAQISGGYDRRGPWAELPPGLESWPSVIAVAVGPHGDIYALTRCHENSCVGRSEPPILKFDRSGKLLKSWGSGMFEFPHGLYVDSADNVWTTDTQTNQVLKFSSNGKLLMTIGKKHVAGSPPELLSEPTALVANRKGDIFVIEGHSEGVGDRVDHYSKDGRFISSFGSYGSGPGMLNAPHCIAMDSRGRLFIGDRSNNRVEIFTQTGEFVAAWTQFGRPSGIFIGKDDTLYVSDSESNTAAAHSSNPGMKRGIRIGSALDGKVSDFIEDLEASSPDTSGPEMIAVDRSGTIFGGDNHRRMIERFVKVSQ